eukprot:896617-Amphidinium_carterae.2
MGFNQAVGVDLFFIQGVDGTGQVPVLSMLCWGTLPHVCVVLKDKTAKRVRKAYRRNWLNFRVFQPPCKLISDQGGEFVGAEFCERLETDGTFHEIVLADALWQNGRTERHGGVVKFTPTRARMSLPPNIKRILKSFLLPLFTRRTLIVLLEVLISPTQRVFGTQIPILGGNFGDEWKEHNLSTMSALEAGDVTLGKAMEIRKAAMHGGVSFR